MRSLDAFQAKDKTLGGAGVFHMILCGKETFPTALLLFRFLYRELIEKQLSFLKDQHSQSILLLI